MNGLLVGLVAMLPMLGLILFWQKHPRGRSRGLAEACGAIVLAVLLGMLVGSFLPDPDSSGVGVMLPITLGGAAMALSLNRMVRDED